MDRLTERTIKLIERDRKIVLKGNRFGVEGWYLGQWTNIAAGPDEAKWTNTSNSALEIFNLKWAFALAKLYQCKVYSVKR